MLASTTCQTWIDPGNVRHLYIDMTDKEKCILLWGCVPNDKEWNHIESKIFLDFKPNAVLSQRMERETARCESIRLFLKELGITYIYE